MRRRDLHSDNPRRFGDAAEDRIARRGYRKTPGSGASSVKGDLRRGDFMIEVKATRHDSFRVDANVMGKLRNDTLTNGKPGVLIVETGDGNKFAILPLATFERLVPSDED
jgi:hypothetical protein